MDIPNSMLFQWHITERCNLRCAHCYQEGKEAPESSFEELEVAFAEILRFMAEHRKAVGHKSRASITVTGGEPFVHPRFFDLLDILRAKGFPVAVLTNGWFVDRSAAKALKKLDVQFVQISIEGTRETHDAIRGRGSYGKAIDALAELKREGVPAYVSFTAHRQNSGEFHGVAEAASKLGVERVWSDRLIPLGQGAEMEDLLMSPSDTRRFVELMSRSRTALKRTKTEVAMHRALQFAGCGSTPYFCKAGDSLLTLLPGGELVPCRRMPIPVGNFLKQGLWELYNSSPVLESLRDSRNLNEGCKRCFYSKLCKGGLKCLAYALTGDPWSGDPGCWMRKHDIELGDEPNHGCLQPTGPADQVGY